MTRSGPMNDSEILTAFFEEFANPTHADWMTLIQNHPEHAASLADAHLASMYMSMPSDEAVPPIDEQAVSRTLARVMSLLHTQTDEAAVALDQQIDRATGKAARAVAKDVGLASSVDLFNNVIAGRVLAPLVVLKRLAALFCVPPSDLTVAFHRRFERAPVAAFKSEGHKPAADALPLPWADAVRRQHLSAEVERELLALQDEHDAI